MTGESGQYLRHFFPLVLALALFILTFHFFDMLIQAIEIIFVIGERSYSIEDFGCVILLSRLTFVEYGKSLG